MVGRSVAVPETDVHVPEARRRTDASLDVRGPTRRGGNGGKKIMNYAAYIHTAATQQRHKEKRNMRQRHHELKFK